ncbi:RodZ domain-containing protein [Gallibacterium anatis]|uniref:RodZ domain-containing protein n=1 Tax=Gallibacterium anatis TaxID=750 RepID=UPI0039FB99A1
MDQEQLATNVDLGQQLRNAREQLGLTIEQVAEQTNLRPAILKQFEENQFVLKDIPATFARGYLRNYLKFLHLPATLLSDNLTFGAEVKNDLNKNHRTKNSVNRYVSHHRWLRPLSWIVLIIIIGMTVLWWWQDHQRSANERENFVEEHSVTEQSATDNAPIDTAVVTNSDAVAPSENSNNTETAVTDNNGNTETTNNVGNTQTETAETATVVNDEGTTVATNDTGSNSNSGNNSADKNGETYPNTSTEALATEMNKIDGNNSASENGTATNPVTDVIPNNLKIEITGESCWLSVKDANRKTLAEREYRRGEILDLTGDAPYSLIIGAPQNVKISYQGQDVPLKIDGRVAKLTLPAQQ